MQLLTAAEAASRARMSVSTLKRLIAADAGPAVTRLGEGHSRILVREDALNEWIERRTEQSSVEAGDAGE